MTDTRDDPVPRDPEGRTLFAAVDPRDNSVIELVPEMTADDVGLAVHLAREAAESWRGVSYRQRAEHLLRVRDLLVDRIDRLVDVICAETGKLAAEAIVAELMGACELIGYYAKHGERMLRPERVRPHALRHKRAEIHYDPVGVVGVISPWNYPFVLSMTPIATALFAGNTVVLKPSEVTPLTGRLIGELFAEVGGHPDIVQVVTGGGATGEALVRSGVDKICFTGSVGTGRRVMAAAAETLTPVVLELGGKDPMIVCADADLDRAASGAVWGAFQNAGQTCMSVERVYVDDSVHDAFVDKVVERALAVRQGVGQGNDIGSMTFPPQVDVVERHLQDAVGKGARILTGGRAIEGREGLWWEPTVLVDVDHSMQIMRDETFGPVLPIMRVASTDEALALANSSEYGLSSSVWTSDEDVGRRLAAELRAGNVCVNDCLVNYAVAEVPYGGVKSSGIGRVHGVAGLREFCDAKAVVIDRGWLSHEIQWFPLPDRLAGITKRLVRLQYRRGLRAKLRGLF